MTKENTLYKYYLSRNMKSYTQFFSMTWMSEGSTLKM